MCYAKLIEIFPFVKGIFLLCKNFLFMDITDRLKEIIGDSDLKKFADLINADPSSLTKYLKGTIKPTTEFYRALTEKLHISISWLIAGIGSKYINADSYDTLIKENLLLKDSLKKITYSISSEVSKIDKISKLDIPKIKKVKK